MKLLTVTKSDLIQETIDRFYPFTFSIEQKGVGKAVEEAIGTLNDVIYLPRHKEYPCTKIVTLDEVVAVVTRVSFNSPNLQRDFYLPYPYDMGQDEPFANEDILAFRSRVSMARQVRGISMRSEQVNDKLYLEDPPAGATVVHIEYLPYLDKSLREWTLFPREKNFVEDYSEAVAKEREGRFLRKGKFLEAEVDADDLVSEGRDDKDSLLEKYKESSTYLIGVKS